MIYRTTRIPPGENIERRVDALNVPDSPVIPFIRGAAVGKAYGGRRETAWMELFAAEKATYDFERLMEGATSLKCSEFGNEIIGHMG